MSGTAWGGSKAVGVGAVRVALMSAALCGALSFVAGSALAQDKSKDGINVSIQTKDTDAGLVVSAQATAKETALPVYPGARLHKQENDESSSAKLGLWGNTFGFKLVVLKMESNDAPEKVAAFYQKALGKYGKVLNCGDPKAQSDAKDDSGKLSCKDDHPDGGEMVFKSGTKEKQHIVGVKPNGTGTLFQLVYLEARGTEAKDPA
jgi:hypothetical protein